MPKYNYKFQEILSLLLRYLGTFVYFSLTFILTCNQYATVVYGILRPLHMNFY